jgi:hypothetical protein
MAITDESFLTSKEGNVRYIIGATENLTREIIFTGRKNWTSLTGTSLLYS